MAYIINEECFRSNEFLEYVKNRKNTSNSNQNLICLEPEIKIQNQDTLSIFTESSNFVSPNSNKTKEKNSDFDNKNDNNIRTEKCIPNFTNNEEIQKNEEKDIQLDFTENENQKIKDNTADKLGKDLVLEEGMISEFFNCENNIISNKSLNSDHTTDELHRVDILKNEFWGNIYMITRENTLHNKKIPYTQKHVDENRKNDLNNDLNNAHKNRRVTFDEKLNSYVFINETKNFDKSSTNIFDSTSKNSLQIYTQLIIQMKFLSSYLYERKTFRNFEKKNLTNITTSNFQSFDKVRNKEIQSTIKEYKISMIDILYSTAVTSMKDIYVMQSYKDYGNHFYTENNINIEYHSTYHKKELTALPYYKENEVRNMQNKTVISYCKTKKNDADLNKTTENLTLENEISIRKRDSGYFEEVLKNINSAFGFITRTVIKLCYCK